MDLRTITINGHKSRSMMIDFSPRRLSIGFVAVVLFALFGTIMAQSQQPNSAAVIQQVDAAVKARFESVAGFTVTEHYAVYRNGDTVHPVAEMTVETTYRRETGKSYSIVSQSGSQMIRNFVLGSILDNEKRLNEPGNRERSWFTSANYEMKLLPGGPQALSGRICNVLALTPRRKAPYLFDGTLWVDSTNGSIVQVQGTASKSPSMLTGPTQVSRQYANISGFSQAIHARAVSNSSMFGQTVVKIDYQNYHVQLRPPA